MSGAVLGLVQGRRYREGVRKEDDVLYTCSVWKLVDCVAFGCDSGECRSESERGED